MSHRDSAIATAAPVFDALGNPTRLELISRLSDCEQHSITDLTSNGEITRQAITKHLRVLEDAGIVTRRKVGRESRYEVRAESLSDAQKYLARVSGQWNQALARLAAHVEL